MQKMNRVILILIICCAGAMQARQNTPEQRFFDWTSLQFSKEEYAGRRTKMLKQIQANGGGVFLAPARQGRSHGETFRQLDDFLYFTGLELPDAMLVLDSENQSTIIFAPERDARFESPSRKNDFPGRPLADDPAIAQTSGVSDIRAFDELDKYISKAVAAGRTLWVNFGSPAAIEQVQTSYILDLQPEEMLIFHLQKTFPKVKIEPAFSLLARLRSIHSPAEIEAMRRVCDLTMQSIREAAKTIRPGVDERSLEAVLESAYKRGGSQRLAFSSIIKSGPNSLWPWRILASHYDRRNRKMQAGDLVIFDVGCELNYYVSDVGRTFPVSGKFSPEQRKALDLQREVADAIIAAIRPGATFNDLYKIGLAKIPEGERKYMQVGSFWGHHIGLSTGDPSLRDAPLEPGMIFTVEPWYYNHEKNISVFVEDVILVTEDGAENLTANLPRTADGLEKLLEE